MSLFGTGRKEAVLAVGMLMLLAVVVHSPGLFFGAHRGLLEASTPALESSRAEQRAQLEGATNQTILWPAMLQAGASVKVGQAPHWNATARFGEPFSFSGAPVWYPPFWLLAYGTESWRLDLLLCLHTILAAVTMFRCLVAMTLSRYVAFIGGATYGLGWFMTGALDRLPEAAAAAILPFVIEQCWRSMFDRFKYTTGPMLGIGIAMMFATGGTSTAWFGVLLCASYLLYCLGGVARDEWGRLLRTTGTSIVVAGLLTAPLWLEVAQHASSALPPAEHRVQHLQPAGLTGVVTPGLFGDLRGELPEVLAEANPGADPLELLLYPGALVLFLALLGLMRPKQNYHSIFWICVVGLGLILTLDSPLSTALARATGWHPNRPGASLVLVHMALVVLGAMGLENFFDNPVSRRIATPIACWVSIVLATSLIGLAVFYHAPLTVLVSTLTGHEVASEVEADLAHALLPLIHPAVAMIAIGVLFLTWRKLGVMRFKPALSTVVMLDLIVLGMLAVPRVTATMSTQLAERIPTGAGRVLSVGTPELSPRGWLSGSGVRTVDTEGQRVLLRSAAYLRVVDPSMVNAGYRSRIEPLFIAQFLEHPLLAIAGIDSAIAPEPFHTESFKPLTATPGGTETFGVTYLAVRDRTAPRARIYYRTLEVRSRQEAASELERYSDELNSLLILEGELTNFTCRSPSEPATIEWLVDTPNHLSLAVTMGDGRGHLLLADAYANGWTATVDGQPVSIRPGQLAFRSIELGEGSHRVDFRYVPWSAEPGFWLFLCGIVISLLLLIYRLCCGWHTRLSHN